MLSPISEQSLQSLKRWQLQPSDSLHREKEMPRIISEREKSVFLIESLCLFVDGLNFHRLNSNLLCKELAPPQSVKQEEFAKASSLNRDIHSQPSDQYDGDINLW